MDFSGALSWLKLSPKYLVAIAIATGIVLFSPTDLIVRFGLTEIRDTYKPFIGLGFVSSLSLVTASATFAAIKWVRTRIKWKSNLSKSQRYLHNLTNEEADILRAYLGTQTKTLQLPIGSGVVQGLVNNHIIYRAANVGNLIDGIAFNIQPWAWEYLTVNLHLLFTPEEMAELLHENL